MLLSDFDEANRCYNRSVELLEEKDPLYSKVEQNIGVLFCMTGDYLKAIGCYQKAYLQLTHNQTKCRNGAAALLIDLGSACSMADQYELALDYFKRAEKIISHRECVDTMLLIRAMMNMGFLYNRLKEPVKALKVFRSAERSFSQFNRSLSDDYLSLATGIAESFLLQHQYDSSMNRLSIIEGYLLDCKTIDSLWLAKIYTKRGEACEGKNQWQSSISFYRQSRQLLSQNLNQNEQNKLTMLVSAIELCSVNGKLAHVYVNQWERNHDQDLLKLALDCYHQTLKLAKKVNGLLKTDGARFLFNESLSSSFYGAMETSYLLKDRDPVMVYEELFGIAEESRNMILNDDLKLRNARLLHAIPDSLRNLEESLLDKISKTSQCLNSNPEFSFEENTIHFRSLLNYWLKLQNQLVMLQETFMQFPGYRKTIQIQDESASLKRIRNRMAAREGILEYFIGDSSLYIFVIKKDSSLVKRATLDSGFRGIVSDFKKCLKEADLPVFRLISDKLYKQLITPVKPFLKDLNKLIIIPGGPLVNLPFEVLHDSDSGNQDGYLVNNFEIVYHFSATLWAQSSQIIPDSAGWIHYAGFAPCWIPSGP
ncbi:MAG: tetratricopeptide repeat protein, partial [Bacteroidota bacterium]